ncbi:MAG: ABC transporter ATP-binding protein [Finegoldia sp.]|nr:ABC transporter ATP-binding protein [Finegoldia sp.]
MAKKSKLEVKNVSKYFYRSDTNSITHAIKEVSFEASNGEFISIVGPSGCGKSTILRMIAGLIVPTMGELTLDGERITGPNADKGLVFQQHGLFPWLTVGENVAFGLKGQDKAKVSEKVDELIDMVGLNDFKDSYPHQLSGGMAQRVALIRTMIVEPAVFLLDEPFGALDAFTRLAMQDELLKVWRTNNPIMIMVTHDIDEAIYMSNRVLIMKPNPGEIKEDLIIDLPYPRDRLSDKFIEYRKHIIETLEF